MGWREDGRGEGIEKTRGDRKWVNGKGWGMKRGDEGSIAEWMGMDVGGRGRKRGGEGNSNH